MGEAILSGLLAQGWAAKNFLVPVTNPQRGRELAEKYGVVVADAATAVAQSQVVLLGVKPQDGAQALAEIASVWQPGTLLISILVGIDTAKLRDWLGKDTPIIRVMPNTPAQIGAGISGISASPNVSGDQLQIAKEIFTAVGEVLVIPEKNQDALAAISGSGPAYFCLFVESLIDAGVAQGLPREVATKLAITTCLGSAQLMAQSELGVKELRDQVTSPGGTTIAALQQLEEYRLRAGVSQAVASAVLRSAELRKL